MPPVYSSEHTALKPCKLTKPTLLAIGRLVRACAEIEDLVTLFICNLAEISTSKAIVLLGMTPMKRRLEMAEYLASMIGPRVVELHRENFNAAFWEVWGCRNAVAHGVLMGRSKEGRYAFLTGKTVGTEIPSAWQIVESYLQSDIEYFAAAAEAAIPLLEKNLRLQPLRAERLRRPLAPHRKAQPRREKGAKQPRQPRS